MIFSRWLLPEIGINGQRYALGSLLRMVYKDETVVTGILCVVWGLPVLELSKNVYSSIPTDDSAKIYRLD